MIGPYKTAMITGKWYRFDDSWTKNRVVFGRLDRIQFKSWQGEWFNNRQLTKLENAEYRFNPVAILANDLASIYRPDGTYPINGWEMTAVNEITETEFKAAQAVEGL